jgi:hypothetical protein
MLGDSPTLTPSGHLVFGRNSTLWAAPFDRNSLDVRREAVPVLEGVSGTQAASTAYAVSADGTLVYTRRLERAAPLELLDRSGARIRTLGEAFDGVYHAPPRFSADGAFVAVCRHPVGGGDQLTIYDLRRGGSVTAGGGDSRNPVWSPDGQRVSFMSNRKGTPDLFEVAADRSSEPQALLVREGPQVPWSWTPDGQVLAFTEGTLNTSDIWVLPRGGKPSPVLANPAYSEGEPAFSLDGKYLAYSSTESGRSEVYVQGYPKADRRIAVSTNGGSGPQWARDGLYFQDLEGTIFFVPLSGSAGVGENPTPQRIMSSPSSGETLSEWDVSHDGRSFVTLRNYAPPAGSFELVLNWFAELKRLASAQ